MLRRVTIRQCMAIIAVVAVVMAMVAEGWRVGFPRRVRYDKTTAVAWLSTVCRSDVRKYDHGDVDLLLEDICKWRLLIGRTRKQITAELGSADDPMSFYLPVFPKKNYVYYRVGRLPAGEQSGFHRLILRFDEVGICRSSTFHFPPPPRRGTGAISY